MTVYELEHLWRPEGFVSPAWVDVDASGYITTLGDSPPSARSERVAGVVVPGVPNLHSHAFQRAMAGLAEHRVGQDDFWSWRQAMYGFVERLGPEDVEAIAFQLYVEMLEAGYTSVGEFHYLHHDLGGEPYESPHELAERVVAAAHRAGIGITILPVLYAASGFDGSPPRAEQRRFATTPELVAREIEHLTRVWRTDPNVRVGLAPHSLRAVPPPALSEVLSAARAIDPRAPIHIHVAEQALEVEASVVARGRRPVEWLCDSHAVDSHWCLVHATHVTPAELSAIAQSGATVGLCPSTEANLGDGRAPVLAALAAGVPFGIGSDSHVSVSPTEELRLLEYVERLNLQQRNVLADELHPSTGARLFAAAVAGGARALGRPIGALTPGGRADWVVLDTDHPSLAEKPLERVLDAWVFCNHGSPVRDVMVGGSWVVRDGRHRERDAARSAFRSALARLRG
ncbi:MAG: formimidoylglutamate deiminase [Myxococcales bacterium]|nr:formimidoylglutamate deiminase [Myxococcales bacterium]